MSQILVCLGHQILISSFCSKIMFSGRRPSYNLFSINVLHKFTLRSNFLTNLDFCLKLQVYPMCLLWRKELQLIVEVQISSCFISPFKWTISSNFSHRPLELMNLLCLHLQNLGEKEIKDNLGKY